MRELRAACAEVAHRAQHVRIDGGAIPTYAAALSLDVPPAPPDSSTQLLAGTREELAAFWLTLDAINFGSGWFPTLRKRGGRSGYFTIAAGVRKRFAGSGPWSASELTEIDGNQVAAALDQEPDHELMELFAASLRDFGRHVDNEHGGRFSAVIDSAGGSAVALATHLGSWSSFSDTSTYDELRVPFLKRAQIAAADIAAANIAAADVSRGGAGVFRDLGRLTMFADNLVPHVMRLDGILSFEPSLVRRIERGSLIEHGSPEEVEIRACALHAVELIVAARPGSRAAVVDQQLWHRGQGGRYKASPRHRSRCTAY